MLGFEYSGCEARYDREPEQTHPVGPILRISIEDNVEFRLTYAGLLYATQREPAPLQADNRAGHKHEIRKIFHPQLKRLWEITPFLKSGHRSGTSAMLLEGAEEDPVYDIPTLAGRHSLYGFNFVPLVTSDLNLICGLDILFLRPDRPGGLIWAGDIDNRLKTLFDSLRIPEANERYSDRTPGPDEKPFFCLLEDDKLITKISVETDQLLQFVTPTEEMSEVRLVITVRLRPYEPTLGTIQFG
jgi:hypothetical protein